MANNSHFTENDLRLLDKTIKVREQVIDALTNNKVPTHEKDVLALISTIESLDKSIFTKAKIRIEEENSKNMEESQAIMKSLILTLHNNHSGSLTNEKPLPVLPNTITYDIRPEELIKDIDNISIDKFK